MAIMALSNQNKIFDPVRRIWVVATPEEKVRQMLIAHMISPLGYPKELMAVEVYLKECERRVDIVCYGRGKSSLFPLLIIECKQKKIDELTMQQVLGYNYHVQAHFIAIANHEEIRVRYGDKMINYLPHYHELLRAIEPS